MAHILIIDDDINLLQMIRIMLERAGHEIETARDGQQGLVLAAQIRPDLVIIDVMMPELSGYDVLNEMRANSVTAQIPIIILTARSQPMDRETAFQAGANAFIAKPVTTDDLADRVEAVLEAGVNYRVNTDLLAEPISASAPPSASTAPAAAPRGASSPTATQSPRRMPIGAENSEQPAETAPTRLPVATVLSLRGGTGCTTVAVNLAFLFANQDWQVCLTDLSTAGGHAQLHMHLAPKRNWGRLLSLGDRPDPHQLNQQLLQYEAVALSLLAAPPLPTPETLSTAAMQHILRELANTYTPIIVDTGRLDQATLGALQVSSIIIIVLDDDPSSVQTTGQTLIALQNLGTDLDHTFIVLNHTRPTFGVRAETIQQALKRPLVTELPYDPQHSQALRQGVPLVLADPNSPFSQAIRQLAQAITA